MAKKKVENFIPLVSVETEKSWRNKVQYKPLFKSYVFVNVTEQDALLLSRFEGVISLLHWLGRPAIINESEINSIKEFIEDYQDINLEKMPVNSSVFEQSMYRSSFKIEGNVLTVKNKTIKINLPSLGYAMIAKLKEDGIFIKERSFLQNYTFAQS